MGARETALNVLIASRQEDGWSNGLLKNYISRDGLDKRDAALSTRLCYGVLQNRYRLDFYLQQLLTGKVKDLHPAIRDILHLGLYQICEMDKVPQSAAVNESVDLAKKYCKKQRFAPGLVNAVLRKAANTQLAEPTAWQEKYSHPQALIDLLKSYVGKEHIEPMLKANNEVPDTVIQVNTLKTTAQALAEQLQQEGVTVHPHAWLCDCLVISGTGNLEALPSFREGRFYVQDAAAKLSVLCAMLPSDRDWNVLDCCAAPGGKSFAAAIAMQGRGAITSCDVYGHKTKLISAGATRLGICNLTARQLDATEFVAEWENQMDAVICDVPCSGYGIIRKKPDIRYKNLKEMEKLPQLQRQILWNQARYVRPGGVLLYSTCTLVRAENEDMVENFLQQHPDYFLEPLELPGAFPANTTGMLALVPGQYDTDGFFIARLRRKSCT
jgi:16S rRNA (cytosine967-C5)-methyltransferase